MQDQAMMKQDHVKSLNPDYGQNYDAGYIGFQFEDHDFISEGIAYFTRWDRLCDIRVSHAFIVACENECIEAVRAGVKFSKLEDRFNDPHCHVFFRKPLPWTHALAQKVIYTGAGIVGRKYDFLLIMAMFIRGTMLGEALYRVIGQKFVNRLTGWFDMRNRYICSEFVAYCLQQQPEYRDKGCLNFKAHTINPQQLFGDDALFKTWKKENEK